MDFYVDRETFVWFLIWIVFFLIIIDKYNKNVIAIHMIINKNVIATHIIINKNVIVMHMVINKYMIWLREGWLNGKIYFEKLQVWKNSPYRKPLILKGVRQVGKTWILKEFGRRYYKNTVYFNWELDKNVKILCSVGWPKHSILD